ncbi:hypothetical protein LCGC14_2479720, partial [marine sediment metagenome]
MEMFCKWRIMMDCIRGKSMVGWILMCIITMTTGLQAAESPSSVKTAED